MRPEDRLRSRCRMYLADALPAPGFWSAIEHGRQHHGDDGQRMREWQRLKAQGVKTGLADLFIWYRPMFIPVELKVGDNDISDAQDAFALAMHANGFSYHVERSVVGLHDLLVRKGVPIAPSMRIAAMNHDAALSMPEKAKKPFVARPARKVKPTAAALRFGALYNGVG